MLKAFPLNYKKAGMFLSCSIKESMDVSSFMYDTFGLSLSLSLSLVKGERIVRFVLTARLLSLSLSRNTYDI